MWNRYIVNQQARTSVTALALSVGVVVSASTYKSCSGAAAAPVAQEAMLDEFSAALERLVQCYDNIEMEVIFRTTLHHQKSSGPDIEEKIARRYLYRASAAKCFRMDSIELNVQDESPTGKVIVEFFTPQIGHQVAVRERKGEPFVLSKGEPDFDIGMWLSFKFLFAPYLAYPTTTAILLEPPYFVDASKTRLTITANYEGDDRLVAATFYGVLTQKEFSGRDWHAKLVFYRDKSWALKEARLGVVSVTEPMDEIYFCRCEYEGMYDGVPLLKRAEYWREVGPERRRYRGVDSYEVIKIKPGPPPVKEFSPASLGLVVQGEDDVCLEGKRDAVKCRRVRGLRRVR